MYQISQQIFVFGKRADVVISQIYCTYSAAVNTFRHGAGTQDGDHGVEDRLEVENSDLDAERLMASCTRCERGGLMTLEGAVRETER